MQQQHEQAPSSPSSSAAAAAAGGQRLTQFPHHVLKASNGEMNRTECVNVELVGSGQRAVVDQVNVPDEPNTVDVFVVVPIVCSAAAVFFSVVIVLAVLGRRRRNKRKEYRDKLANDSRISVRNLDVKDLELAEVTSVCVMGRDYRTLSTVTTDQYSYVMHVRDNASADHRALRQLSLTSLSDKSTANVAHSDELNRSLRSGSNSSLSAIARDDEYMNTSFRLPNVDDVFRAVFSYSGQHRGADAEYDNYGQLTFDIGDVISGVTDATTDGWWRGMCNGRVGWFPGSYVESYSTIKIPQSVRFSDSSECIEADDKGNIEPNFYETIEDVALRIDKESTSITDQHEQVAAETSTCRGHNNVGSVPEYHRSRICTPSPRRRWILKPTHLGEQTCYYGASNSLAKSATTAAHGTNDINTEHINVHGVLQETTRTGSAAITPDLTVNRNDNTERIVENCPETYENLSQLTLDTLVYDTEVGSTPQECRSTCSDGRPAGKVKDIVECLERVTTSSTVATAVEDPKANPTVDRRTVNGNNVGRFFGLKADFFNAVRKKAPRSTSVTMKDRVPEKQELANTIPPRNRRIRRSLSIASSSSFCAVKTFNRTMSAAIRRLSNVGNKKVTRTRPSATETRRRCKSTADDYSVICSSGTNQLKLHKSTSVVLGTKQLERSDRYENQSCKPKRRMSDRTERGKPTVPYKPERLRSRPMHSRPESKSCEGTIANRLQQHHQNNRRRRCGRSFGAVLPSSTHHSLVSGISAQFQTRASSNTNAEYMWARCDDHDNDAVIAAYRLEHQRHSNALYGNLDSRLYNSDIDGAPLYYDLEEDGRSTAYDRGNNSLLETFGGRKDDIGNDDADETSANRCLEKPPSIPPKPGKIVELA